MRLSLITHAIHRRVWVYGMALMVGSFGLQATALARGRLSVVQPILTLELPFLVLILVFWFGQRIGWHEVVGATASAGGLAAFLTFANPQGGDEVPNVRTWGIASFAGIIAIVTSVGLARRGPVSYTHLDVYKRQGDWREDDSAEDDIAEDDFGEDYR